MAEPSGQYQPTLEDLARRRLPFAGEPTSKDGPIAWTPSDLELGTPDFEVCISRSGVNPDNAVNGAEAIFRSPDGRIYPVVASMDTRGGFGKVVNRAIVGSVIRAGLDLNDRELGPVIRTRITPDEVFRFAVGVVRQARQDMIDSGRIQLPRS